MKISVCMATYNGARYVEAQLQSIESQLRDGDELLVADDGSTDDTVSIVLRSRKFVRILSTTRAGGVVPNFERVIASACGDAIVLCDQDDVWLPGRVDLVRDRLRNADLVMLNGQVVDENLELWPESVFDLVNARPGFFSNLVRNSFVGCCMAFRSSLRDRIIPFPSGVPWHDWYIGLVASAVGRVEYVQEKTMFYRRHAGNASPTSRRSGNSLLTMLAMRVAVLRAAVTAVLRRPSRPAPIG